MTASENRTFEDDIEDSLRRNYTVLMIHGMLGQTGFRLLMAPIFLPAFLFSLSGSTAAVGAALALQHLGSALSSLIGATIVEHRKRVLRVLFAAGSGMRLQILAIALAGFFLSGASALVAICVFLFLFGLFIGMQGVAFNYVLSKLIPVRVRGRITGLRNVLAGLCAAGVSFIGGSYFIEHNTLGNGYSTTFLLAFVLTVLGMLSLVFVKEPEPPTIRAQSNLLTRLKEVPALLREDMAFARFVLARGLAALGTAAVPFYILYLGETVGLSGELLGLLGTTFMLAQTASNIAWGTLSDRFGNRFIFILAIGIWCASTLSFLFLPESQLVFMLIFAGLGAGLAGFMISSQNLQLEFGERDDLPMRIGIGNTMNSIVFAIGPLAGGLLVASVSFQAVFILAALAKLSAIFLMYFYVDEPRHREVTVLPELDGSEH